MSEEPLNPDALRDMIAAAARLLPAQGPIASFVALNPLHGFEDLPFERAVEDAARLMNAQPYMEESFYRDCLATGRIRAADIDAVLAADLGDHGAQPLAGGRTQLFDVQRVLLTKGLRHEGDTEVRWTLTESDAIERLRSDLPQACRERLLTGESGHGSARAAERRVATELWQPASRPPPAAGPHSPHAGLPPGPAT
ncbi:MAG: putative inorganic carbon transporter subunit DabA [Planctomycetota bacterium]